jgi:hypothetical protein
MRLMTRRFYNIRLTEKEYAPWEAQAAAVQPAPAQKTTTQPTSDAEAFDKIASSDFTPGVSSMRPGNLFAE